MVYSNFSEADKNKFKKLFLHKRWVYYSLIQHTLDSNISLSIYRDALHRAYDLLASSIDGIRFQDFLLFMHEYRPNLRMLICTICRITQFAGKIFFF